MIKITDLTIKYNNKLVIDRISFNVLDRKCIVLFGPSGCGKTSILNAIANLISYQGIIDLDGKVSYCFQNHKLFKRLSVIDNLLLTCNDNFKIVQYLEKFELKGFENVLVNDLSEGQKARVNIIRSLISNDILLLDEPFASLDLELKKKVMDVIKEEISNKKGTILVTHDIDEAQYLGDEVLYIKEKTSCNCPEILSDFKQCIVKEFDI